jgi:hypothetical protein
MFEYPRVVVVDDEHLTAAVPTREFLVSVVAVPIVTKVGMSYEFVYR